MYEFVVQFRLLDERCWRGIEIDTPHLRLTGLEGHILLHRPLLHLCLEPLCV